MITFFFSFGGGEEGMDCIVTKNKKLIQTVA